MRKRLLVCWLVLTRPNYMCFFGRSQLGGKARCLVYAREKETIPFLRAVQKSVTDLLNACKNIEKERNNMKALYVHPSLFEKIKAGEKNEFVTRYHLKKGDSVMIESDNENSCIITAKVKNITKKDDGLFLLEIESKEARND